MCNLAAHNSGNTWAMIVKKFLLYPHTYSYLIVPKRKSEKNDFSYPLKISPAIMEQTVIMKMYLNNAEMGCLVAYFWSAK